MDDLQTPKGSSGAGSALTCLGIGCGAVLLLALIASVTAFAFKDRIRNALADRAYETMEAGVESSTLHEPEKTEVLEQLARLRNGVQHGEIGMEDLGAFMREVGRGPLQAFLVLSHVSNQISTDDRFSEVEREEAESLFKRYMRGRVAESLSLQDDRELAESLDMAQEDDGITIKVGEEHSIETLRNAIQLVRTKVETANVPEGDQDPDFSSVLKKIIDPILK